MIFEAVRENISVPNAAQLYGISSRNGNVRCIFHADNTPSMKLYDDHFHCFGCGAHGDVTDLTVQMFGLSKIDAARKLCSDFGLSDHTYIAAPTRCKRQPMEREKIQLAFDVLTDYIAMLKDFRTAYIPSAEDETPDPRFIESLQQLDYAEYLWDMLLDLTDEERAAFISANKEQFRHYYDRLKQFDRLRPKQRGYDMSTSLKERTA